MWSIDPAASHVTIVVGKAGLFGFAGHSHEVVADTVSGDVRFDPEDPANSSVVLEIDAGSLRVTGEANRVRTFPRCSK